tara:strand:- start:155 stop:763 length:609 start_codon:yes stop_codon:yes gene_type:complete
MYGFTDKLLYSTPTSLPEELINSMVNYVENREYEISRTNEDIIKNRNPTRDNVRSSLSSWIPWDEWIPGIMFNMIQSANRDIFNYDIYHWTDQIQSTIYTSENKDHYAWHVDNSTHNIVPVSEQNPIERMERKLSISLLLSDPDEYEGGEFQIHYYRNKLYSLKPEKGTAIIFPSWVPHRVRPVTSGKRISLVGWVGGPLFR